MTNPAVTVRDAQASDETAWRELWAQYLSFYETDLAEDVTAATWLRLVERRDGMWGRVAESSGRIVGFSVSVLHAGSWTVQPVCYLEDLFVAPEARGGGAGKALIADLMALARINGWSHVYWHTRQSNAVARRLYDQFGPADDFVRYRITLV
jgi:ribosomal protein S18 acetylase RimI-like enzyme